MLVEKGATWNKSNEHDDSLRRIRAQMAAVCAKLPTDDSARTTCDDALRPSKSIES